MPAIDYSGIEQQYGLPAGLLAAQQQVESGGNPNAVSLQGAVGIAQLMPATAKSLGVDPHDPVAATIAQARLNRQNLDATGGDIDRAMMMYHGGPDTRQWGPKTEAYPGKILAALTHGAPSHAPGWARARGRWRAMRRRATSSARARTPARSQSRAAEKRARSTARDPDRVRPIFPARPSLRQSPAPA